MKSSTLFAAFTTTLLAVTAAQKNIDDKTAAAAAERVAGSSALKSRKLQVKTTPSPVAVSADFAPSPVAASYCSNGLAGIDGSNSAGDTVCCPVGCGQCGGSGCGSAGLPTYDNTDCCVNGIVNNQEDCIVTGAAPCINTFPECQGRKDWIGDGYCDEIFGLNNEECGYDAGDCCECECVDNNYVCGIVGFTCVDPDADRTCESTCSNDLPGIEGSNSAGDTVCCPVGCGQCGGSGCGSAGLPTYDNTDCCVNGVVNNQGACADTGAAPCVISETCSNGVAGIEGSNSAGFTVCCPLGCGQCGGSGCGSVGLPAYDNTDCCVNGVVNSRDHCDDAASAPCVIVGRD